MKFAICNETFQDWPHERAFAFARECGYTGIEIAPFTLADDATAVTEKQRAEIRSLAEKSGLEVIGLHWLLAKTEGYYLTSRDAAVRRRTAKYLGHLARLCSDLGGKFLVFGSPQQRNLAPGMSHDEGMDLAAEVFRAAMPELEAAGVTLAIEPLGPAEGNFLLTAASGMQLVERVASPNCRLHLDCKAMSSEATPIPNLIRQFAHCIVHFHANDPNRQGPGFGELDFGPIFAALRDVGYERWVSVEVFDYAPGVERLARGSIEYMRAVLEKV
jgi:sugar phosphate isomerase/epimerase